MYKNYGTIKSQELVEEFYWNNKLFYSYLISFNEYEGYFRIIRDAQHEQALIGGIMIFNYSNEKSKIEGYRIAGYKKTNKRLRNKL